MFAVKLQVLAGRDGQRLLNHMGSFNNCLISLKTEALVAPVAQTKKINRESPFQ